MKSQKDVSYEAYGSFKNKGMLYSLSVSENFSLLSDARQCVKMLKRAGCRTVIHRIVRTPETRTAVRVR